VHRFRDHGSSGLAKEAGMSVRGIYIQSGDTSGGSVDYVAVSSMLRLISTSLPEASPIIPGHGICISLMRARCVMDMKATEKGLEEIKEDFLHLELWLDPGRFIISHAGVLLTRVKTHHAGGEGDTVKIKVGLGSFLK
jgi:diaminopimelate decarboxylase/aspartate kinase